MQGLSMQGTLQFRMGPPCALSSLSNLSVPLISGDYARLPERSGTQFRVSISGKKVHGARVPKFVSRASQENGDGDETEDSSWDTLPLATEENLQRMVAC